MTSSGDCIQLDERGGSPAKAGDATTVGKGQDADGANAKSEARPRQLDETRGPTMATGATPRATPARWARPALFGLLPLALIAGGYAYVNGGAVVGMNDAYVEADKVGVSTDVSGIVKDVDVKDNQAVAAGQILYRLDDLPFKIALARAEARLGAVRDDLNALKANYLDVRAQVAQGKTDADYYGVEAGRQQDLLDAHVASQSTFDTARRNLQAARQKVVSLDQQLAAVAANLNGEPAGPVERNPRYLEALAERDEAARQLAHATVRAPFAGVVTNVPSIAPGKFLQASMTAFYLVAADHAWVNANPKETELTHVRTGQPVTVKVDTYPDARWRGVVESVSPAVAQEFSLLPAQNSSGNWVKVVQRIPMRVRVDTTDRGLPPLRAGMSVEIAVDTGHKRGPPRVLAGLFGPPGRRG
jgi:membrane fusion protein (multidrug efflux system)